MTAPTVSAARLEELIGNMEEVLDAQIVKVSADVDILNALRELSSARQELVVRRLENANLLIQNRMFKASTERDDTWQPLLDDMERWRQESNAEYEKSDLAATRHALEEAREIALGFQSLINSGCAGHTWRKSGGCACDVFYKSQSPDSAHHTQCPITLIASWPSPSGRAR